MKNKLLKTNILRNSLICVLVLALSLPLFLLSVSASDSYSVTYSNVKSYNVYYDTCRFSDNSIINTNPSNGLYSSSSYSLPIGEVLYIRSVSDYGFTVVTISGTSTTLSTDSSSPTIIDISSNPSLNFLFSGGSSSVKFYFMLVIPYTPSTSTFPCRLGFSTSNSVSTPYLYVKYYPSLEDAFRISAGSTFTALNTVRQFELYTVIAPAGFRFTMSIVPSGSSYGSEGDITPSVDSDSPTILHYPSDDSSYVIRFFFSTASSFPQTSYYFLFGDFLSPLDNLDVSDGVQASINYSGQVLNMITTTPAILTLLGLCIALSLVLPFGIRKLKEIIKGY